MGWEEEIIEDSEAARKEYRANDTIGAKYMMVEQSIFFLENAVFVFEVPVSEHNKPKVKEGKVKDIQN